MVDSVSSFVSAFNFFEIHKYFLDQDFYKYVFPFLLVYAILVATLPYVRIFQLKNGKPIMPVIMVVSVVISIFGVSFPFPSGFTIGDLLIMMFPNISAFTIGVLSIYIVGALLGFDFLKGFGRTGSANIYFALGAIGLGSIVYYMGIVLGAWSTSPFDELARWNTILVVSFIILGVVFAITRGMGIAAVLLFLVVASFLYNGAQGSILSVFLDPGIIILIIFTFLFSWVTSPDDQKKFLALKIQDAQRGRENITKANGGVPPEKFESRVYDTLDEAYENNIKKFKEQYPGEDWRSLV